MRVPVAIASAVAVGAAGLVLAAPTGAAPTPTARGDTPMTKVAERSGTGLHQRIVHGRDPVPGEFGFLVALANASTYQTDGLYQAQFCGGTLVTSTVVVTAAHCLVDEGAVTPAASILVASAQDLNDPAAKVVPVATVNVYPQYNETTTTNDVAVLTLAAPLDGVPTMTVISPTEAQTRIVTGAPVTSAGWGTRAFQVNDFPSSYLVADLQVFPYGSCGQGQSYTINGVTFQGLGPNDANPTVMICAGGVNSAGQIVDTCQGDSGGPLVNGTGTDARLVGVVSFGQGCAGDTPGVYTRLSAFASWLAGYGVPLGAGGTTPASPTPSTSTPTPTQSTPTVVPDRTAPKVQALVSFGKPGGYAKLRYRIWEKSGITKEKITVRNRASRVVIKGTTNFSESKWGEVYVVRAKLPWNYTGGIFCVRSYDKAGNYSALSCNQLRMK
ncbi:MAG: serine protease [Candidatus Nanopelagicales bacterium]